MRIKNDGISGIDAAAQRSREASLEEIRAKLGSGRPLNLDRASGRVYVKDSMGTKFYLISGVPVVPEVMVENSIKEEMYKFEMEKAEGKKSN